jgi:hypothetical protein
VERLSPLVRDAVRKRLVADVPLGAFLSGGLDSTVVVGLMSELTSRPVKTFSIGFEGEPAYDELEFAEEAARRFDCDHKSFRVQPPGPELMETLVRHHNPFPIRPPFPRTSSLALRAGCHRGSQWGRRTSCFAAIPVSAAFMSASPRLRRVAAFDMSSPRSRSRGTLRRAFLLTWATL